MNKFFLKTKYIFMIISLFLLQSLNLDAMLEDSFIVGSSTGITINYADTNEEENQKPKRIIVVDEADELLSQSDHASSQLPKHKQTDSFSLWRLVNSWFKLINSWLVYDNLCKEIEALHEENNELKIKTNQLRDETITLSEKYLDKKRRYKEVNCKQGNVDELRNSYENIRKITDFIDRAKREKIIENAESEEIKQEHRPENLQAQINALQQERDILAGQRDYQKNSSINTSTVVSTDTKNPEITPDNSGFIIVSTNTKEPEIISNNSASTIVTPSETNIEHGPDRVSDPISQKLDDSTPVPDNNLNTNNLKSDNEQNKQFLKSASNFSKKRITLFTLSSSILGLLIYKFFTSNSKRKAR